jgi:hypothetical protein
MFRSRGIIRFGLVVITFIAALWGTLFFASLGGLLAYVGRTCGGHCPIGPPEAWTRRAPGQA